MTDTQIKFTDGSGYEEYMGVWSQLAGLKPFGLMTPMSASNSKVRVLSFGLSLDGYGAGPNQNLTHPLG